MPIDSSTGVIAHAIQLAVAPVLLLSGIGGLLGVMANRLARVVEEFLVTDLRWAAGALFVAAMLAVICGLGCFLREVYLATHTMKIDATAFE